MGGKSAKGGFPGKMSRAQRSETEVQRPVGPRSRPGGKTKGHVGCPLVGE